MDEYEYFLTNIKNIAITEIGAPVYIKNKKDKEKKFKTKYKIGYQNYIKYLNEIGRLIESIQV